jgi:hypothetical protein
MAYVTAGRKYETGLSSGDGTMTLAQPDAAQ